MSLVPRLLALAIALCFATLAAPALAQEFGYSGELGPDHWADLDPAWSTCDGGGQQSPVDFARRGRAARFPRSFEIHYEETEGEIFDNGHTIEVETEGESWIRIAGERYDLVQFHFHTPSEHTLAGRGFDAELHLVHRSATGRLAVIGVFLRRGASSGALTPIFEALPDTVGPHAPLAEAFDPGDFLPLWPIGFRYDGSLTTPPCSEGVRWTVFASTGSISDEHLARLAERVRFNARRVQRSLR